ncbi:hypothetical protein HY404_03535 [Candidatus Microgenomates bacterium]|nr:hypothetical protein [Candidatus Microgenomates bacterium]
MVERSIELSISPEKRKLQAVAAAIILPSGLLYTIEGTTNRPEYGKMAGMRSIPMETMKVEETHFDTLFRLAEEELGNGIIQIRKIERVGMYGIGVAGLTFYRMDVELLQEDNVPPDSEVTKPLWMSPAELIDLWVRQGVVEMIEDLQAGKHGIIRETAPVPLEPRE